MTVKLMTLPVAAILAWLASAIPRVHTANIPNHPREDIGRHTVNDYLNRHSGGGSASWLHTPNPMDKFNEFVRGDTPSTEATPSKEEMTEIIKKSSQVANVLEDAFTYSSLTHYLTKFPKTSASCFGKNQEKILHIGRHLNVMLQAAAKEIGTETLVLKMSFGAEAKKILEKIGTLCKTFIESLLRFVKETKMASALQTRQSVEAELSSTAVKFAELVKNLATVNEQAAINTYKKMLKINKEAQTLSETTLDDIRDCIQSYKNSEVLYRSALGAASTSKILPLYETARLQTFVQGL